MSKLKILILCGGESLENEISLKSGKEVKNYLDKSKYESILFFISKKDKFPISKILKIAPDFVFIIIHGGKGEDGTLQKILEKHKLLYLGSGARASRVGMDKIIFHKLMEKHNILMPNYRIISNVKELDSLLNFGFPIVAKPFNQGSSIGVSICNNIRELKRSTKKILSISKKAILEEYISGVEASCGILGNNVLKVLPVAQIIPKNDFFDYQAKYDPKFCQEIIPAKFSTEVTNKIKKITKKVFVLVGCKGFARVDMIISNNKIYVLEINTLPGLTKNSIFPKEAKAAKISYSKLLNRLIELGRENKYLKKND